MIAPNAVPTLWKIAHDRTEIPAGEFLEELAAIPLADGSPAGRRIELSQQTLSNYVRRGWVPRQRVATAPGGRGQTGYFERRALIVAIFAHEQWAPHWEEMTARQRKSARRGEFDAVAILASKLLTDYWHHGLFQRLDYEQRRRLPMPIPDWALPASEHHEWVEAHLYRANIIACLSRLLEDVPRGPLDLVDFAPDVRGRAAIEQLRAELERAMRAPVTEDEEWSLESAILKPLRVWLASKPGSVT